MKLSGRNYLFEAGGENLISYLDIELLNENTYTLRWYIFALSPVAIQNNPTLHMMVIFRCRLSLILKAQQ